MREISVRHVTSLRSWPPLPFASHWLLLASGGLIAGGGLWARLRLTSLVGGFTEIFSADVLKRGEAA
jgi:hypothetical protein